MEETLHISGTDIWEIKRESVDCIHQAPDGVQKEANI
jgi:hypothetical protein